MGRADVGRADMGRADVGRAVHLAADRLLLLASPLRPAQKELWPQRIKYSKADIQLKITL